jgi:hypothetical protein
LSDGFLKSVRKHPKYVSGISLGQANEFTALAIIECVTAPDNDPYGRPLSMFSVRHLERFMIGTVRSYLREGIDLFHPSAREQTARGSDGGW